MGNNYEVKISENVVVITLWDQSFSTFTTAIKDTLLQVKEVNKKIWMMQSVEKENEPLRIFIVFQF